ncbi:MAG: 4-hydroxyphenylacetate 3-hydroxylase N-terminal domain-containing protein [Dehalococcoidia bacterium]|nr:4-hydroxybutyryl-CoA dehydratase/vinylacetyl-CoA-Delta-isomerase [Chloroflexota bacterium]MBT9160447.1 4-hydroxybutyryl-CoA dehydratase/vinylacetyl-CoA-Delta-isomerase [Chloroflexota bacterium]MBT9162570.1 4-hydroxybutyryl-CoA dehydratase/vinylacetyl-CoA-Delta-isomerase [Chloroflexota bacterium]
MITTPQAYKERLSKLRPGVHIGGGRVEDILDHPETRTLVEANAKVYELALAPEYEEIMTAVSPPRK